MSNLPESFLAVMREILKEEYPAFLEGYQNARQYGLRVNTDKISTEQFERIAPFHLTKIPWIPDGYYYEPEDQPARHPFYAAGLYYLQEPSAMTPASRLPVNPGDRVLDLCAAPGGKATALGARLHQKGVLVANDINQARTRALLRNLELFGISNVFITNEPPYRMAEAFPEYFDKIMVDAPCSGEGMFRKNPAVIDAWLEKGPDYFSKLQKEIILYAFDMLKPGGIMFYSTCTFSPMENEAVITHLLSERENADLLEMEDYEGFSSGLSSFGTLEFDPRCVKSRRIFPHRMNGEGHFMALICKLAENESADKSASLCAGRDASAFKAFEFAVESGRSNSLGNSGMSAGKQEESRENWKKRKNKKSGKPDRDKFGKSGKADKVKYGKSGKSDGNKSGQELLTDFLQLICDEDFRSDLLRNLEIRGDKVYYVPNPDFEGMGLHFLRNGVYLGDLKKNRFEPSEPFALILSEDTYGFCLDFRQDDERLVRYLRGESFDVSDLMDSLENPDQKNGWCLVTAEHFPLGFGKLVKGTLKNKYPAGWRVN